MNEFKVAVNIAKAQIQMGYPTYLDIVDGHNTLQIDYSKFGGIKRYTLAKNLYWYKFNSKNTYSKIAEIWWLCEINVRQLIKEFKEELNSPIKYYND